MSAEQTHESQSADGPGDAWEILQSLFAYRWLILLCAVAGVGLAFFISSRMPRVYQADCSLEYIPNPPRPLGSKIEGVANPFSYWSNREYFATQNLIIASDAVAERAAEKLGLQYDEEFMGRSGLSAEERAALPEPTLAMAVKRVSGSLSVVQERATRLVHIRIKDTSPERAALLANTVAEEYMSKSVEDRLGSTTAALDWLGGQLDGLKGQLEHSELALHEFKEKNHSLSISLKDRQNIVAADIQRYSEALTGARTSRIQLAARLEALEKANSSNPLEVHATAIDEATTVRALRKLYATALAERDETAVEYGPAHPKLRGIEAKLAVIKSQMRAEVDGVIRRAAVDLGEIVSTERGLRSAVADANSDGMALNLQEIEYRRLTRERDNTAELYAAILERTAETDLARALRVDYAQIIDRARVPSASVSPRLRVNLPVGGIMGALVGLMVSVILLRTDRSLRDAESVEALGLTVLGLVPGMTPKGGRGARSGRRGDRKEDRERDLVVHLNPKSPVAECCRTVRTNLTFAAADSKHKTLLITSASPREGKTTVSINLAVSMAQSGKRVLLVDTDLRKPRVHRAFGLRANVGVTSILVGDKKLGEAAQETEVPGLSVLASGPIPPNPSELLHTSQFRQLIEDCRTEYDLVMFDSPPLAAVTDAAVIAPQVDGVVLVVHARDTTRDSIKMALRQLRDVSSNIVGGVLNVVDLSSRKYGYGSYYYYNREGYGDDRLSEGEDDVSKAS